MRTLLISINGKRFEVQLDSLDALSQEFHAIVDGQPVNTILPGNLPASEDSDWLIVGNKPYEILLDPDYHWIKTDSGFYAVEIRDRQNKASLPLKGDGRLRAPIPGLITQLMVSEGETVEAGQPLLILEAMKMENEIRAPHAGRINVLNVKQGQGVKLHDVLVEIG